MRLAWALDHNVPDEIERELVRTADEQGLESLWTMENHHLRDGVTTAVATLERTNDIGVVMGTLSPFFRHPIEIGLTAATLQRMYPGRVALNLGVGMTETFHRIGIDYGRPLSRMRETVEIIEHLFSGERFAYEGSHFEITKHHLSGDPVPMLSIVFSVMGEQLVTLAGEVADGVNLPLASSPEYTAVSVGRFEEGGREGGRDRSEQVIVQEVLVHAAEDPAEWGGVRRLVGFHFSSDFFKPVAAPAGLDVPHQEIHDAFVARDFAQLDELIPDDMLRTFAAVGSPDEILDRLEDYEKAGADVIILYTAGDPDSRVTTMRELTAAWKRRGGAEDARASGDRRLFPS